MSTPVGGTKATAGDLIPGAFELRPTKPRQAGSMSGPASGTAEPPGRSSSMDADTIFEHKREGGRLKRQRGDV